MLQKVYCVFEYCYVRKNAKLMSIHSTYEGAYNAMETLADYEGNNGYGFNIVKNKEAGTMLVQSIYEDSDGAEFYMTNVKAYKIKERTLFT